MFVILPAIIMEEETLCMERKFKKHIKVATHNKISVENAI